MQKNRTPVKIKTEVSRTTERKKPLLSTKAVATYLAGLWCLFFLLLFTPFIYSQPITQKIKPNEPTFIIEKDKIIQEYKEKTDTLLNEINLVETEIAALRGEADRLAKNLKTSDFLVLLFSLTDYVGFFILIFFPVMVINHFIYLVIREKEFFERHRKLIIITFAMIEVLFFAPFLTYAQSDVTNVANTAQPTPFEQKLIRVNYLLNMSDVERMIYILENTKERWAEMPVVEVHGTVLKPTHGKVYIGSPDYYFTLAGLYAHTKQKEKAYNTLKQLLNLNLTFSQIKAKGTAEIYFKVLEFYIENNELKDATDAAEKLMNIYRIQPSIPALGELSVFLEKYKMSQSAAKAINTAIESAKSGEQIIFLTRHLIESGRNAEVIVIVEHAIDVISNADELMQLSHLLFQKERKELSAKVLEQAKQVSTRVPELIEIAGMAREKGFLSIAIDAIERALIYNPNARSHTLPPPCLLQQSRSLPKQPPITLPIYLGILQQLDERWDRAEKSYQAAIMVELDAIIRSYGYKTAGNINNFFYLKQLWQKTDPDKLDLLIPIYSHLKNRFLNQLRQDEKRKYDALTAKMAKLKTENQMIRQKADKLLSELRLCYLKVTLFGFRNVAMLIFFILVLIGCTLKAIQAAKSVKQFKFFAFFWKFKECLGWSTVFSIIGAGFGIAVIIIAQLMAIFHSIQQTVGFRFDQMANTQSIPGNTK